MREATVAFQPLTEDPIPGFDQQIARLSDGVNHALGEFGRGVFPVGRNTLFGLHGYNAAKSEYRLPVEYQPEGSVQSTFAIHDAESYELIEALLESGEILYPGLLRLTFHLYAEHPGYFITEDPERLRRQFNGSRLDLCSRRCHSIFPE
jgi:hypothetical protein